MGRIIHGNSLEVLRKIPPRTIGGIITDPPYEINFANNRWDDTGIAFSYTLWSRVYDVLRPGAYLCVFSNPRMIHKLGSVLEVVGYEIVDIITALYSNRISFGLNVSKAIDKELGQERKVIGRGKRTHKGGAYKLGTQQTWKKTEATSKKAKEYEGYNTVITPAVDMIYLLRRPISEPNVAKNILKHGTGAINRAGCSFVSTDGKNREPKNVILSKDVANDLGKVSRYFYVNKEKKFKKGKVSHPTQKSVSLMEYLIKLIIPPHSVMLDPFCGSGSSLVAAKRLDVEYVGIELDKGYYDLARERLKECS